MELVHDKTKIKKYFTRLQKYKPVICKDKRQNIRKFTYRAINGGKYNGKRFSNCKMVNVGSMVTDTNNTRAKLRN